MSDRIIKGVCRKCGKVNYFNIGNMTDDEAIAALSEGTSSCETGSHKEVIPPIKLFDFDWNSNVEAVPMNDDMFKAELQRKFGSVYTIDELKNKYTIESFAYGGCLCTSKEDGQLRVFNFVSGPEGERFYY